MRLKAKTTSKIGFCLHPENCVFFYDIFSILIVEKSDKFSNFDKEKLDANKLNAIYKKIDAKAYQTFDKLTTEHIKFRISEQTKLFKKQKRSPVLLSVITFFIFCFSKSDKATSFVQIR